MVLVWPSRVPFETQLKLDLTPLDRQVRTVFSFEIASRGQCEAQKSRNYGEGKCLWISECASAKSSGLPISRQYSLIGNPKIE